MVAKPSHDKKSFGNAIKLPELGSPESKVTSNRRASGHISIESMQKRAAAKAAFLNAQPNTAQSQSTEA